MTSARERLNQTRHQENANQNYTEVPFFTHGLSQVEKSANTLWARVIYKHNHRLAMEHELMTLGGKEAIWQELSQL